MTINIGKDIYNFAKELWHLDRSITGEGLRQTLKKIKNKNPNLKIKKISSGKKVYDWTVPNEWKVNEAYIIDPKGKKICDFKVNNLHLVGYSIPINKKMSLDKLKKFLHSIPEQPNAIPYITSYYKKYWGFCITHNQKKKLVKGIYHVVVDTKLFRGSMNYGELIIKGKSKKEIFFSTYVCHPSMANNELSGPCVMTYVSKWISQKINRYFTYRIIFIPETIGSISYLKLNKNHLKKNMFAGFNISCVGDNRVYSFLPSRNGNTFSDFILKAVLKKKDKNFIKYTWKERGSDERQYCSPGIDLPVASFSRSKYGTYKEYHTSLDNLQNVVSKSGLKGSFKVIIEMINLIENSKFPKVKFFCEPKLSKRGLYPTLSTKNNISNNLRLIMNLISYSDGKTSISQIAKKCNVKEKQIYNLTKILVRKKILNLH
jgi:aminopeptidase-like protein